MGVPARLPVGDNSPAEKQITSSRAKTFAFSKAKTPTKMIHCDCDPTKCAGVERFVLRSLIRSIVHCIGIPLSWLEPGFH
jgi:hypothetical protein